MAGLFARLAASWLGRRDLELLYRGQREATARILSPLARQDLTAHDNLLARMRTNGLADKAIAGFAARWHDHPVPPIAAPPGLAGQRLGAVGITLTSMLGLAADYAADGVICVLRLPASLLHRPLGWPGLELEAEYVLLEEPPDGSVGKPMPAKGVPSLMINERDLLTVRK